ncbi:hypothetical protein HDC32_000635 [Pseudomonas sp. JAI120]|nr:hypothetical protein [Pseudomonas sp. JAI120]
MISGVVFAACHAFLALSVTQLGWPVLLFTPDRRAGLRAGAYASWRVGCNGLPWHGNPADCGALYGLT